MVLWHAVSSMDEGGPRISSGAAAGGAQTQRVRRTTAHALLRDSLEESHLVALIGEEGVGKRSLVEAELAGRAAKEVTAFEADLSALTADEVSGVISGLVRTCGEALSRKERVVVGIIEVPFLEGDALESCASDLRGLERCGVEVIMTMHPEGESLVDELPGCAVLHADDLVVDRRELRFWGERFVGAPRGWVLEATHGIPLLVDLLRDSLVTLGPGAPIEDDLWDQRLSVLAADALRPELMDEERSLRAAMIVLGRGSLADVAGLGLRVAPDVVSGIARDAPLFGVDLEASTFDCLSPSPEATGRAVAWFARDHAEVLARSVELLMSRGAIVRGAGIASRCLSASDIPAFVSAWPVELVEAGYGSLARRGVLSQGVGDLGLAVAEVVCASLVSERRDCSQAWALVHQAYRDSGKEGRRSSRSRRDGPVRDARLVLKVLQAELFGLMRSAGHRVDAIVSGAPPPEEVMARAAASDDPICRGILLHLEVSRMLVEGRVADAYARLSGCWESRDGSTLSAAILCCDHEMANALLGHTPGPLDLAAGIRADRLLEAKGLCDIRAYRAQMADVCDLLLGTTARLVDANRGCERAARRRDGVIHACILLTSGFVDARDGAWANVHVGVVKAQRCARRAGAGFLAAVAQLLDEQACMRLGDVAMPTGVASLTGSKAEPEQTVQSLAWLARATFSRAGSATERAREALGTRSCPASLRPLLLLLAGGGDEASRRLAQELPDQWSEALGEMSSGLAVKQVVCPAPDERDGRPRRSARPSREAHASALSQAGGGGGDARVDIHMLGELTVRSGGRVLTAMSWRRKAARMVVAILATEKTHQVPRFRLINLIWPSMDLASGRQNLYSALACARTALDDREKCLIDSMQGTLFLNPEHVTCDIDEFEGLTRTLRSTSPSDAEAVACCHEIQGIYRGDLFVPPSDPTNFFKTRREELRQRYVDAMVTGSEAATRLGRHAEALWFAGNAWPGSEGRADVTMCYLRELLAAGRHHEARAVYEKHSSAIIRLAGRPPSPAMRALMRSTIGGSGGGEPPDTCDFDFEP